MADVYTDERRWMLSKGYYESLENFVNDYSFSCPRYSFSYFAALTANSVYSYYLTEPFSKHYMSSLISYDRSTYAWLGYPDHF